MSQHQRTIVLLVAHYGVVALAALAGLISEPVAYFLPMGLVPVEEALIWKRSLSSADRLDRFAFGTCVLAICGAFLIYGLGLTLAAWIIGGFSLAVWTAYGFWRAIKSGGF